MALFDIQTSESKEDSLYTKKNSYTAVFSIKN